MVAMVLGKMVVVARCSSKVICRTWKCSWPTFRSLRFAEPYISTLCTVLHFTYVMWCLMSATSQGIPMLTIFIGVIPRKCIYTVESSEVHSARIIMVYRSSTKDLNAPGEYISRKMQKEHRFHDRASIQACRYK